MISTGENLTASAGDKVELLAGEDAFSAVVVDSVDGDAGETVFLLVARMGPETRPERIKLGEQESELSLVS